ncbi:Uncharacterised protein [Bordetella pertussis]|nr:Uncharacterised protein [Bordetella pertussis]
MTTTLSLNGAPTWAANSRANMSTEPPAGNGTISVMLRVG